MTRIMQRNQHNQLLRQRDKKLRWQRLTVVALLAAALGACATLTGLNDPPRVSLVRLEPVDLQLLEQRFRVSLRVQNPNDRDITIRGLDYAIVINDKVFAQGVSGKPMLVPAWGESIAELEVVSTLERIIEQLQTFGERASPDIDYALSGHVRIDGVPFPIPFQYSGSVALPGTGKRGDGRQQRQPSAPRSLSI